MDDNHPEVNEESIYDFIDIEGLRRYLFHYPHLVIMLEFLIIHIDGYLREKKYLKFNHTRGCLGTSIKLSKNLICIYLKFYHTNIVWRCLGTPISSNGAIG